MPPFSLCKVWLTWGGISCTQIAKKIKKAKTDMVPGGVTAGIEIISDAGYGGASQSASGAERWDHADRPEAANLLGLYGLATVSQAHSLCNMGSHSEI
jgi:hypothetical protein